MKLSWGLTPIFTLLAACSGPADVIAQIPRAQIEQLKSPDAKIRAKAAREIGKAGDTSAIPALAAALGDPSDEVRREVVKALSGMRRLESLDALITATRDTDPDVRALAVEGVVGYYTGETSGVGLTGLVKKGWQRARSRFVTENTRIDPGIRVDPKAISALEEAMKDERSIGAAREAAKGLGILAAKAAVPSLVISAHSADEDLAREALNALSRIKDRSAGPQLIDLLDSPNKEVKKDAAVTVGILRTGEALPKLQTMFENNPDKKIRLKALEGLAYLGDRVSLPLFTRALWNDDKEFRTLAAEGLARAADAKALAELEKAVHAEKDAGARLAVQYALTALGKEDYLSAVVTDLRSLLRGEPAQAYLIELARDSKFLPKLYPYMNSQDAAVRRRLCAVLMFSGDATSIEHLERLSHDPKGEVASEALRALRAVRLRAPTQTPAPARSQ